MFQTILAQIAYKQTFNTDDHFFVVYQLGPNLIFDLFYSVIVNLFNAAHSISLFFKEIMLEYSEIFKILSWFSWTFWFLFASECILLFNRKLRFFDWLCSYISLKMFQIFIEILMTNFQSLGIFSELFEIC